MADDVRIATGLRTHRKTKRLRRALGGDGCWALVCLFLWAGEERWTGDLAGLTDEDIEEEADWRGEPGELVTTLVDIGFLKGEAGQRRIHDWETHNPYAASKGARIAKGKRAVEIRWERERERQAADAASNGAGLDTPSMPGVCGGDTTTTPEQYPPAPAPAPTPTPVNPIITTSTAEPAAPADGMGMVGQFEGHAMIPASTPNPVARFAIALNNCGFQCTPINPNLIAYVNEGGTVDGLVATAMLDDCKGKKAGYVIGYARRELTAAATPIPEGPRHETRKRLSATERIEANVRRRMQERAGSGDGAIEGESVRLPR